MRTKLQRFVYATALAAASLMLVQPARSDAPAEPVRVRLEARSDFARLSFPWRRNVGYEVSRQGNALTISFAGVARIEGTDATGRSRLILAATAREETGRTAVILTLVPEARVRHFRKDLDIIVDILPPLTSPRDKPAGLALALESDAVAPTSR